MTREEIIHQLTVWQEHCLDVDAQWAAFADSTGATVDSPLGNAVWRMVESYTGAVADLVGAESSGVPQFAHDLSWYAYENDWGRKGHEAGVNGDMRAIRTPADLAWLMTECAA